MNGTDLATLARMQLLARTTASNGELLTLADELLRLRDLLTFDDKLWFNLVTQHIATLDSAASFLPKFEAERAQASKVVAEARDALRSLIEEKQVHLSRIR